MQILQQYENFLNSDEIEKIPKKKLKLTEEDTENLNGPIKKT